MYVMGRIAPQWRVLCQVIGAALWLALGVLPAPAETVRLIVDRLDDAVEVYLSLPAERAEAVFGLPPEALVDDDGFVPFDVLRLGTADVGDALWSGVEARIGGAAAEFEAMSLMVHPRTDPLPIRTPFQGLLAILVCTAPDPATPPRLADLQLYAGLIAYTDQPDAAMRFRLPQMGAAEPVTVVLREFHNGRFLGQERVLLAPGAVLQLDPAPAQPHLLRLGRLMLAGGAVLLLLAAGLVLAPRLRRRRAGRDPAPA